MTTLPCSFKMSTVEVYLWYHTYAHMHGHTYTHMHTYTHIEMWRYTNTWTYYIHTYVLHTTEISSTALTGTSILSVAATDADTTQNFRTVSTHIRIIQYHYKYCYSSGSVSLGNKCWHSIQNQWNYRHHLHTRQFWRIGWRHVHSKCEF